jgi:predicted phosphodiesterase
MDKGEIKQKLVNWDYRTIKANPKQKLKPAIKDEIDFKSGTRCIGTKLDRQITSEAEALEFFEIDRNRWKVDKMVSNFWGSQDNPNYQTKLWLSPLEPDLIVTDQHIKDSCKHLLQKLDSYKGIKVTKRTNGTIVVAITDIHLGNKVDRTKGVIKSPFFDSNVIIEKLFEVASIINEHNAKNVHLVVLGDMIESLTGLMHVNAFKKLEENMIEGTLVIATYKLLLTFFEQIQNLQSVSIVPGNHDRIATSKQEDSKGEAGRIIAFFLKEKLGNKIPFEYNPLLIQKEIDGINYLWEHGDHALAWSNFPAFILRYGRQDLYNVHMRGHTHKRRSTKRDKLPIYGSETHHIVDNGPEFRSITVAPIFTGDFFYESKGNVYSSGFSVIQSNKNNTNVHHFDYSV